MPTGLAGVFPDLFANQLARSFAGEPCVVASRRAWPDGERHLTAGGLDVARIDPGGALTPAALTSIRHWSGPITGAAMGSISSRRCSPSAAGSLTRTARLVRLIVPVLVMATLHALEG